MGFGRNMFDRLVHLMFGMLIVPLIAEVGQRYLGMRFPIALIFAILFVLGISAVYEIFEWLLAVAMDPVAAELYNGQQGDVFDSQKDMGMAGLGAVFAAVWQAVRGRNGDNQL